MKKVLKQSLKHIRNHVSTGTAFNEQLISTQVETIYMLDKLKKQTRRLNLTIKIANKQNDILQKINQRLQIVMFILAFIATLVTIYGVIQSITTILFNGTSLFQVIVSIVITWILTVLIIIAARKMIRDIEK